MAKPYKLVKNLSKDTTLLTQARLADTFFTRLKGLLGSPPLQKGEGLILKNEKSIHTLFMGFSIDVVYANANLDVIKLDEDMRPYKLGTYVKQAVYIIEMPVGTIAESQTQVGDKLAFQS